MKKIFFIGILVVGFLFQGCDAVFNVADELFNGGAGNSSDAGNNNSNIVNNHKSLKDNVYKNAINFVNRDTKYVSGAMGRVVYPFDCSGFVTRCYDDALKGTNYKLTYSFTDKGHPSAGDLKKYYSTPTDKPERGDLVFLNFSRPGDGSVNHVGIFDSFQPSGKIKFIDASDYRGYEKVVDYRTVSKSDKAFVGFGVMNIKHK